MVLSSHSPTSLRTSVGGEAIQIQCVGLDCFVMLTMTSVVRKASLTNREWYDAKFRK